MYSIYMRLLLIKLFIDRLIFQFGPYPRIHNNTIVAIQKILKIAENLYYGWYLIQKLKMRLILKLCRNQPKLLCTSRDNFMKVIAQINHGYFSNIFHSISYDIFVRFAPNLVRLSEPVWLRFLEKQSSSSY